MSDFSPALNYVLDFEDPKREYLPVPDKGGFAIAGINSSRWPGNYRMLMNVAVEDRPSAVASFYEYFFWNRQRLYAITSQDIANRVMDASVNTGSPEAARLLQECVNGLGASLQIDSAIGSATIKAINAADPTALLAAYRAAREQYYRDIVAKKPEDEVYLNGWLKRAEA